MGGGDGGEERWEQGTKSGEWTQGRRETEREVKTEVRGRNGKEGGSGQREVMWERDRRESVRATCSPQVACTIPMTFKFQLLLFKWKMSGCEGVP